FIHRTLSSQLYPLSLHDALPISSTLHARCREPVGEAGVGPGHVVPRLAGWPHLSETREAAESLAQLAGRNAERERAPTPGIASQDRKSPRLNSSHLGISDAGFFF